MKKAFYYYRQDNPSSSVKSKKKIYTLAKEYDYIAEELKKRGLDKYIPICNYLRMLGHFYTYNRIDYSLRSDYSRYIVSDYDSRKNCIDTSLFKYNEFVISFIENLKNDAEGYYNKHCAPKKRISETIEKYENIIVYGTGQRSQKVVYQLIGMFYYDRIYCAAMTDTDKGSNDKFMFLPVYNISDIQDHRDDLVLIAVKKDSAAFDEIVKTLDALGFANYIDTEVFLQF